MSQTPPPSGRPLPFKTKLGYGLGNLSVMTAKQAPKQLALPIYNVALGVNPGAVGTLLALGRVWDAVTDPLVGYWSDKTVTRWGRRKPFILAGAISTSVFFAAMWMFPRGLAAAQYLGWFAAASFLFYLALGFFSVPWYAMGYELADSYDERTKLMAFPSALGPVGQILVGWLYWFTQRNMFADTVEGVRWVGMGAGAILLLFGLAPVLLVKERPLPPAPAPPPPTAAQGKQKPKTSFIAGVKAAMDNGPFMRLTAAFTLIVVGTSMVGGLGFYVHVYYLFGGDTKAASALVGWHTTLWLVCSMCMTPLMAWLSVRFGKKEIFIAGLAWGVLRMAALWFLLVPAHPWLVLANAVLAGVDNAAIFMLCHAMIADVCDLDELHNGTRREGLFGALYGWFFKTGIALSFAVSGYVLAWIGFNRDLGGAQPPGTLLLMKACYCGIPALMFLAALAVFARYPISRRVADDIRARLAAGKQREG
ncbi:MAG: MFS transporter [Opitutaceae bacterium]|jgi:GPH family glycoside/pentoside/hexuronide:cation symporter|nr:MFS transporter [Opitutaceae bacterium]